MYVYISWIQRSVSIIWPTEIDIRNFVVSYCDASNCQGITADHILWGGLTRGLTTQTTGANVQILLSNRQSRHLFCVLIFSSLCLLSSRCRKNFFLWRWRNATLRQSDLPVNIVSSRPLDLCQTPNPCCIRC